MEESFGPPSPDTGANSEQSSGVVDSGRGQRSPLAGSVERVVDIGAAKAHGAIDVSKDALQAGVRQADAAVSSVKDKTETALGEFQQRANDVASRVARSPQVEEMTRNLEQQIKDHPIRTLAVAIGLGVLVGRSLK